LGEDLFAGREAAGCASKVLKGMFVVLSPAKTTFLSARRSTEGKFSRRGHEWRLSVQEEKVCPSDSQTLRRGLPDFTTCRGRGGHEMSFLTGRETSDLSFWGGKKAQKGGPLPSLVLHLSAKIRLVLRPSHLLEGEGNAESSKGDQRKQKGKGQSGRLSDWGLPRVFD